MLHLSLLQTLGDFAAIATENARHIKTRHALTITEESTGLSNARHLGCAMVVAMVWSLARTSLGRAAMIVPVCEFVAFWCPRKS
jgi:hypothetical protein